jgi:hypothetical protein
MRFEQSVSLLQTHFYCSDLSGKKKRINVAITGNTIPIKNQILGSRPIRFANLDVMMGMQNKTMSPMPINVAAPILVFQKNLC